MDLGMPTRTAITALLLLSTLGSSACQRKSETAADKAAPTQVLATPTTAATVAVATPHEGEHPDDDLVLVAHGDPDVGRPPLTVKFTVESLLEKEMSQPQYTWDFGDGSAVSHEASPVHTYTKPGDYLATIRVVDASGQRGWDEVDIEVVAAGGD
jgi:hypothetical protein